MYVWEGDKQGSSEASWEVAVVVKVRVHMAGSRVEVVGAMKSDLEYSFNLLQALSPLLSKSDNILSLTGLAGKLDVG